MVHTGGEVIHVIVLAVKEIGTNQMFTKFQGVICMHPRGKHDLIIQDRVKFEGRHIQSIAVPEGMRPRRSYRTDLVDVQNERGNPTVPSRSDIETKVDIGTLVKLAHYGNDWIWVIVQRAEKTDRETFNFHFQGVICVAPRIACELAYRSTINFEGRHIQQIFA